MLGNRIDERVAGTSVLDEEPAHSRRKRPDETRRQQHQCNRDHERRATKDKTDELHILVVRH